MVMCMYTQIPQMPSVSGLDDHSNTASPHQSQKHFRKLLQSFKIWRYLVIQQERERGGERGRKGGVGLSGGVGFPQQSILNPMGDLRLASWLKGYVRRIQGLIA